MPNRIGFTSYGSNGSSNVTNVDIDNSTHISAASLQADNLTENSAVKTDANRKLISTNLEVSDINTLDTTLNNKIDKPVSSNAGEILGKKSDNTGWESSGALKTHGGGLRVMNW